MSIGINFRAESYPLDNSHPHFLKASEIACKRQQFMEIEDYDSLDYQKSTIYDILSAIKDPEHNATLEDLEIITPDNIKLETLNKKKTLITIVWVPTIAHCSYATQIALAMRVKLMRNMPNFKNFKVDIFIEAGKHLQADIINKQANDKERVAAAMENKKLMEYIETLIKDDEY